MVRRGLLITILLMFSVVLYANAYDYYEKGEEYFKAGNYEKARELFRKAFSLDKKFGKAYRRLIDTYLESKDCDGFYKEAKDFLENGPRDVDLKAYVLAKTALLEAKKGNFKKADTLVDRAIRITSNDKDKEDYEKVKKIIFSLKEKYINSEYKKAEAFYNAGDKQKALSILRKLTRLYPENRKVASLYLKITNEIGLEKLKVKIEKIKSEAQALEANLKWEEANSKWQELVLMAGEKLSSCKSEYEAFKKRWADWKLAERRRKEELERKRREKEEYKSLIQTLKSVWTDESWSKAIRVLKQLKKKDPYNPKWDKLLKKAKINLAFISRARKGLRLVKEKKYKEAINFLEQVYQRNKSPAIIRALAVANYKNGNYEKTIKLLEGYLKKVKIVNENIIELYLILANSYINTKQFAKAQYFLNKYVSYHKDDDNARYILAKLYIESGKYKKAEKLLNSFAIIAQGKEKYFNLYRRLYEKSGNFDKLAMTYRRMINVIGDPTDKEYRKYCYQLAKLYYKKGFYADAYVFLKKAMKKMPKSEKKEYPDIDKMYRYTLYLRYKLYVQFIGALLILLVLRFIYVGIILPIIDSVKSGKKEKLKALIKELKVSGKDYKKLIKYAQELINKFPLNVPEAKSIRTAMAEAYLKTGQYDAAEAEAKKVLELDRTYIPAHYIIAEAHFKRGEYPQVINRCRMIFDFEVSEPKTHTLFQKAFLALGQKEDLLLEYEDMVQANPDNLNLRNIYLKIQSELLG